MKQPCCDAVWDSGAVVHRRVDALQCASHAAFGVSAYRNHGGHLWVGYIVTGLLVLLPLLLNLMVIGPAESARVRAQ